MSQLYKIMSKRWKIKLRGDLEKMKLFLKSQEKLFSYILGLSIPAVNTRAHEMLIFLQPKKPTSLVGIEKIFPFLCVERAERFMQQELFLAEADDFQIQNPGCDVFQLGQFVPQGTHQKQDPPAPRIQLLDATDAALELPVLPELLPDSQIPLRDLGVDDLSAVLNTDADEEDRLALLQDELLSDMLANIKEQSKPEPHTPQHCQVIVFFNSNSIQFKKKIITNIKIVFMKI